ncbi:MAG TPA: hypothetical protein VL282_19620, partial [Tepidisphaeraceae bacterium]|nr:hypothetical protein [Tepidisphaeraceae bacterium]
AKIVVDIQPIASAISEGDPRVEHLADEMLDRQEAAAKRAGREAQGETELLEDPAYVRKVRLRYAGKPQPTVVSSRIAHVGNMLVNVITEAPADLSAAVEKLADEWAQENITPIGLSPRGLPEKEPTTRSVRPYPQSPAP